MTAAATAEAPPTKHDQRTIWIMTALGFASGLPYALVVGSLSSWLTNAEVSFTTIGIISWVALAYAFKFLWSPLLDWGGPPILKTVGRRRAWMLFSQVIIILCLFGIAGTDPRTNIGLFAGLAALCAFLSATQDIVIDAWRIEIASDKAPLDILSVRYQLGYRIAAFFGGAVALLMAEAWATPTDKAAGWAGAFTVMAVLMMAALAATVFAPQPLLQPRDPAPKPQGGNAEASKRRAMALAPVMIGWVWAGATIINFMVQSLTAEAPPSVAKFQNEQIPFILFATIGLPLVVAFFVARNASQFEGEGPGGAWTLSDLFYGRVVAPLVDIAQRFWFWAIPILLLVLTYRISDSVWGSFANPFYLGILQHSNADVALASKMVGVVATILGIAMSGWVLMKLGRMVSLILGAVVASLTNLLYADLAVGAPFVGGFLNATGLGPLLEWISRGLVNFVHGTGATVLDTVQVGPGLSQLVAAIFVENVSGGFAGAVYLAWLSSIVNKQYAAVQFAILSSLTLLIGVIFRPPIGAYIDAHGAPGDAGLAERALAFRDVFVFATIIGLIAVVFVAIEWVRQSRLPKAAT